MNTKQIGFCIELAHAEDTLHSTKEELRQINERIHYTGQFLATRDTFRQILNAHNKGKYRNEHAAEINCYQKARDILRSYTPEGKFPSLKSLQARKAELLELQKTQSMELDNMTYYDQGDYVNALKYYGKLLYIQEEILSENHYDIAITCNNMAGVFYKKGDYENAIEYYGKAIELVKHLKGMDNLELASWYNNMAFVLREQGKYDNALELYKKANAIFLSACGKNHPYVEDTQINIMIMETLITTGMTEDELMEMYYQNFGMDE